MKKAVKFIILGFVILAVAAGVIYTMTAPVSAPLTPITAKTAELTFSEQGIVSAGKAISVYPLAQGRLLRVEVREGQTVRTGDVLCVIDSEPLSLQAEELRGVIKSYEAQKKSAAAQERSNNAVTKDKINLQNIQIGQNQRDLDRAREELDKLELLYAEGGVSLSEVDAARALAEKAESALTASRHELAAITAAADTAGMAEYYSALIESSEATLAQLEVEMGNCSVTAPASGLITRLPVKDANVVASAVPVAEITVAEDVLIEAYVSTKDVNRVKAGDMVELVLKRRDGDLSFPGRITRVDSAAEVRLSALGVEERKVKVQITPDFPAGEAPLGSGYNLDVRFILYKEDNKFTVPKTALYKDGGRDMLWVVRGGKALASEVICGMELRTETVIESGLAEGDWVVTDANNSSLKDGVRVNGE